MDRSNKKNLQTAVQYREKWMSEYRSGKYCDGVTPEEAVQWRKKWLRGIKMGESYDVEARYNAASWLLKYVRALYDYQLAGSFVGPHCGEMVLEALQRHGDRPILPFTIDRLEDITIGLGAGFSFQGEACGAVSAHIIAIGMDVAYRVRETALIRKTVVEATRKFCNLFKEKFGAIRCADLTGVNFLKDDGLTMDPDALMGYISGNPPPYLRCDDFVQFCVYAPLPSEEG